MTATRLVKMLLMFSIGAWGILSGLSNLLDYDAGLEQVKYVLSMSGTQDAPFVLSKRIDSTWVATLGFATIYLSKLAAGVLCLISTGKLWNERHSTNGSFEVAKRLGILGGGIGIAMLFLCFIVIAGVHFEYWRVPTYGMVTHQYAFIYILCLTGFLIFIDRPDVATIPAAA